MIKKNINVLVVEDHHMIVNGYKDMLNLIESNLFDIVVANSCEQAYSILINIKSEKFDLVFLDWNLPSFAKQRLSNGGDLLTHLREHSPNCKLIIVTSHTEAFTLYTIAKEGLPDAFLCKSDFLIDDFPEIYKKIHQGEVFFSSTVKEQIKKITSRADYLDNYNRQIIVLLSKGVKTKNLIQYLPLSISTIDKRKGQIKDYFLLKKGDDEDIIQAAKKEGLI